MQDQSAENPLLLGLTTVYDAEAAAHLARTLVAESLAACVHLDSPIRSFFHWNGDAQDETEYRLLLKFPADRADALTQRLHELHPYDVPAWVVWQPHHVAPDFMAWIIDSTRNS